MMLTNKGSIFKIHKHLFSYLIQDSILYLVALSSFSSIQQILVNSVLLFIMVQKFSSFPCFIFLDSSFKSGHCISKYMGFFLSVFDINFSFKCFSGISLCVFQSFSFIEVFNGISLGKCHFALENMWIIFKYLLILISSIIPQ